MIGQQRGHHWKTTMLICFFAINHLEPLSVKTSSHGCLKPLTCPIYEGTPSHPPVTEGPGSLRPERMDAASCLSATRLDEATEKSRTSGWFRNHRQNYTMNMYTVYIIYYIYIKYIYIYIIYYFLIYLFNLLIDLFIYLFHFSFMHWSIYSCIFVDLLIVLIYLVIYLFIECVGLFHYSYYLFSLLVSSLVCWFVRELVLS